MRNQPHGPHCSAPEFPWPQSRGIPILPNEDHTDVLETKNDLAELHKMRGFCDKAERLLLKAVNGRRLKPGDTRQHTSESRRNLIERYESCGKPERAQEWRAKLPQTESTCK